MMFDGPSPFGTLSEYYFEVSGGRFTVSGEVFPWVRTGLSMAEVVGGEWGLGEDARTGEYLFEAVAAVDAEVDFGLFDNDGPDGVPNSGDDDGYVDAVAIQFQEVAASCGGPAIWPHRSRLSHWREDGEPYVTNDLRPNGLPILVNDYVTQSATDCGGVQPQKATTIAHELGHVLGLPDLYDRSQGVPPEYRRWVVGCWSLMAAGAWGCGTESREEWVRPTHMGAWEKERLGWVDEVEVVGSVLDGEFTLEPIQSGQRILKVPLEPGVSQGVGEYLLLEYRRREGFDQDLPASGVLVYHVDPKIPGNQVCDSCPQQYRVSLLEADGNNTLRRNFGDGGNRGEPGDAWGVQGPGVLATFTYPSSRLHTGDRSDVTIYRIALEDGQARINLSTRYVSPGSLLRPFLDNPAMPLSSEERAYVDRHGNQNGEYDVGDLRAYWMR
jgi:M6 family metalloprotease-like protein